MFICTCVGNFVSCGDCISLIESYCYLYPNKQIEKGRRAKANKCFDVDIFKGFSFEFIFMIIWSTTPNKQMKIQ